MQVVCRRPGDGRIGPPAEEGQDGPLYGFTSHPPGVVRGFPGVFFDCQKLQSRTIRQVASLILRGGSDQM